MRRARLFEPWVKDGPAAGGPEWGLLAFSATVSSRRATWAVLLACPIVAGGCGGADGEDQANQPPPEARPDKFPSAEGKTLAQLRRKLPEGGPVLAPSVSQFGVGGNRLGFGLFTTTRAQIADAATAVYVAPVGGGEAEGPFVGRYESLEVKPQFQSQSSAADPDAAKSVYVADVEFPKAGRYEILGMAILDDRLVAASSATPQITVSKEDPVPGPGERSPLIHTPTEADAGGDIESIDTRVPPSTQHEEDFADVVGRKPVVLTFATPRLCQSRVCGPVVDIAEQLKADYGDRAEFIHMEIFKDNEIEQGYRPQVAAWRLPSEPWVFTIDRSGKVAARLEGAFSARELENAIKQALRG
jgi:hypothetical protein